MIIIPLILASLLRVDGRLATPAISDVQQDFWASPKYHLHLITEPQLESRVDELMATVDNSQPSRRHLRITAPSKTKYFCVLPAASSASSPPPPGISSISVQNGTSGGQLMSESSMALAKIEGWARQCITMTFGWWSYDFCHLNQVKQYHQHLGDSAKSSTEPEVEFLLGVFDDEAISRARISGNENSKMLVIKLQGGTLCDLSGRKREVEVHYQCPQTYREISRIALVKETSTCSYLMVVYLSELCSLPGFMRPPVPETNYINCTRLVDPSTLAKYHAAVAKDRADKAMALESTSGGGGQGRDWDAAVGEEAVKALSMILGSLLDKDSSKQQSSHPKKTQKADETRKDIGEVFQEVFQDVIAGGKNAKIMYDADEEEDMTFANEAQGGEVEDDPQQELVEEEEERKRDE
eukprot:Partr_v1_DN27211_c0_g1_i2_m38479 putative endoplasmic reticulum lectin